MATVLGRWAAFVFWASSASTSWHCKALWLARCRLDVQVSHQQRVAVCCEELGCSSMLSKPTPLFLKSSGDRIPWLYLVMTLPSPLWALESRTISGPFRSTCDLKKPLSRGALEDLQPWKWVGFLKVAADDQILPDWELLLWANYQNLLIKTNSFLNKTYSKTLALLCPNPKLSLYCHKLHQITTNSLLSGTILKSPLKFL